MTAGKGQPQPQQAQSQQPQSPKTVLITGANRGIGLELVKEIAQKYKPKHLFATYRKPDSAQELIDLSKKNPAIHPIQLDVTDYRRYPEAVKQVDGVVGATGLNLLINNAGVLQHDKQTLATLDATSMQEHFNTNSVAPVMMTKAFLPLLKRAAAADPKKPAGIGRAAVISLTTVMSSFTEQMAKPLEGYIPYRMSKAALNMAVNCLAMDLKKDGIISTAIHPGWVQTDMGGKTAMVTVPGSVSGILKVMDTLNQSSNGKWITFEGKELQY